MHICFGLVLSSQQTLLRLHSFLSFCEQRLLRRSVCARRLCVCTTSCLLIITSRHCLTEPRRARGFSSLSLRPTSLSALPLLRHVSICCLFINFPSAAAHASRRVLRGALPRLRPVNFFSSLQHLSVSLARSALFARLAV